LKYEIRALGVGEVLDHAISLTQDNLWLFTKIVLVLLLPFTLVSNYVINANAARNQPHVELRTEPQIGPAEEDHVVISQVPVQGQPTIDLSALAPVVIVVLLQLLIVWPLSNGAIIYSVGNCYLDQPIGVGTAYRRAVRVYLPLLITAILTSMAVGVGYIFCFVPGVIFALWFCVSSQVVVLEGLLAAGAMGRSRQLVRGNMLTAFLLWVVMMAISMFVGVIPNLVPQVLLASVIEAVLGTAIFVFYSAVCVVFYFSCRAKAEHFDLAMLADAVGAGTESGPHASPGVAG
jgi:hypothetical protein